MKSTTRALTALLPAAVLALLPVGTAQAQDRPETIPFPAGVQPEGITSGPGTTFFAGAISGGTIYEGDARTGTLVPLVTRTDTAAIGLSYDAATDRIWVAGGPTSTVTAYDARTGEQLFSVRVPGTGFLNDVAVTRDAVYVTDSARPQLVVVPLGPGGALPAATAVGVLPVTGFTQTGAFGLNGVRPLPDGSLLAVDSATGDLLRIDPQTGAATVVPQTGGDLASGDGIELRGTTLYVTRGGGGDDVVQLRFRQGFTTVEHVRVLTDPDLSVPSTVALVAGDLYAVNARFGQPATTQRQVVRVDGT